MPMRCAGARSCRPSDASATGRTLSCAPRWPTRCSLATCSSAAPARRPWPRPARSGCRLSSCPTHTRQRTRSPMRARWPRRVRRASCRTRSSMPARCSMPRPRCSMIGRARDDAQRSARPRPSVGGRRAGRAGAGPRRAGRAAHPGDGRAHLTSGGVSDMAVAGRLSAEDLVRLGTDIQRRIGVKTSRHEPLARFTTMRVGGPADLFAEVHNLFELRAIVRFARARELPLLHPWPGLRPGHQRRRHGWPGHLQPRPAAAFRGPPADL